MSSGLPYFGPLKYFSSWRFDVILLDMDHPHRDIIESLAMIYRLSCSLKIQIKTPSDRCRRNGLYCRRHRPCPTILEISIEQYKKHKKLEEKKLKPNLLTVRMLRKLKHATAWLTWRNCISASEKKSHRITIGEMARRLLDAQKMIN